MNDIVLQNVENIVYSQQSNLEQSFQRFSCIKGVDKPDILIFSVINTTVVFNVTITTVISYTLRNLI